MNRTLLILLISCLTGLWASGSADYSDRENEITADSAFIKNLSDSIRSDYVKDEIKALLDKISGSKKGSDHKKGKNRGKNFLTQKDKLNKKS